MGTVKSTSRFHGPGRPFGLYHLQVSDVVDDGPAFYGKALRGDVVVVDLEGKSTNQLKVIQFAPELLRELERELSKESAFSRQSWPKRG